MKDPKIEAPLVSDMFNTTSSNLTQVKKNAGESVVQKYDKSISTIFITNRLFSYFLLFCTFVAAGLVYVHVSITVNNNVFRSSDTNYYVYLINVFLHGRVNITPPSYYDLSLFQDKWYIYWGPAPILFIIPFYLFSHLQTSDVIYTLCAGLVNIVIFYFVIREFITHFKISLPLPSQIFLILSFAFVSPNFFLSLHGTIWFSNQVIAITYLLLFYFFFLKFLNNNKVKNIVFAVIFFNLAWFSRYSLLFNVVLFLYIPLYYRLAGKKILWQAILPFSLITLSFIVLCLTYNYLKFHNFYETGLRFQVGALRYATDVKNNNQLSTHFIWYNFYYYFLNFLQFTPGGSHVVVDPEGNSVFSVYPVLLLLGRFLINKNYLDKQKLSFLFAAGITLTLSLCFLMLYYATGWMQFGNRYFFDIIPLLFLLILFVLKYIPLPVQIVLLIYGIFVNYMGILAYYGVAH